MYAEVRPDQETDLGEAAPVLGVSPEGCRPGRVRSGAQNDRGMCGV